MPCAYEAKIVCCSVFCFGRRPTYYAHTSHKREWVIFVRDAFVDVTREAGGFRTVAGRRDASRVVHVRFSKNRYSVKDHPVDRMPRSNEMCYDSSLCKGACLSVVEVHDMCFPPWCDSQNVRLI